MSRKMLVGGLVVGLAALLIGFASIAGASSEVNGRRELHFKAVEHNVNQIDVDQNGFTPGDYFVGSDDLMHEGNKAGIDSFQCTLTRGTPPQLLYFQCQVTDRFQNGQITFQGLVLGTEINPGGTAHFAVTGGTGIYRNARGEMTLHTSATNPAIAQEVIRLIS